MQAKIRMQLPAPLLTAGLVDDQTSKSMKGLKMKKEIVLLIIASLVVFLGCAPAPYVPTTHTYEVVVPPESDEGKRCVMQCKQIELQKKQLANDEFTTEVNGLRRDRTYRAFRDSCEFSRDLAYKIAEKEYKECVISCGGKIEKKTVTR